MNNETALQNVDEDVKVVGSRITCLDEQHKQHQATLDFSIDSIHQKIDNEIEAVKALQSHPQIPERPVEDDAQNGATAQFLEHVRCDSTCHGISYIFKKDMHYVRKVLWIIMTLSLAGGYIHLASKAVDRYQTYPITTKTEVYYPNAWSTLQ